MAGKNKQTNQNIAVFVDIQMRKKFLFTFKVIANLTDYYKQ